MQNKKTLFNIVDIAIILVLVAIIAGSVIKSAKGKQNTSTHDTEKIQYTVVIHNTDLTFNTLLKDGDDIYFSDLELPAGKILGEVKKTSAKNYAVNTQSDVLDVKYNPYRNDITFTVVSNAQNKDNSYCLYDSVFIAPGKSLKLYTRNTSFECTVENVYSVN